MKLVWASDIHLNFIKDISAFYKAIKESGAQHVVLSGDIAESGSVAGHVQEIEFQTGLPVHFVMGNHDYYGNSVKNARDTVKHLNYIPRNMGTPLSDKTILVGVDGWGDCRNGDYENSTLTMSDWLYIDDLRKAYSKGMKPLKKALQKLADADARKLKRRVEKAITDGYDNIIIVSHVPPYAEACLYAGRKSTPSGLCFFSSQILGTTIEPITKQFPDVKFIWLCGHTHSKVCLNVSKNFVVKVAQAEYYYPQVAEIIDYD